MSERYEYSSPVKLNDRSSNCLKIPLSIILNQNINDKRATVFSFLLMRKGMDDALHISINEIVEWSGRQPNRTANGINNKILQVIEELNKDEYLMLSKTNTTSSFIKATINISKLTKECETARFAVIYLDELNQIMSYKSLNSKDAYMNVDVILLVFAYLRMKIYRRRNELMPEENNLDNKNSLEYDIESRRKRCPEVYDCFYYEIANDLGLSARVISKAIDVLNELGLIYSEALPRIKYEDKWRTDHTLFCNTYKREKNYLLDTGENYYLREIANKKKKLNINT